MQDAHQTLENKAPSEQPESSPGEKCQFCHSREFKRSRLHLKDISALVRFRVPARCVKCGQLQTISALTARTALPAGKGNGPTHEIRLPQPVQPVARQAPQPAPVPDTSDSGLRAQAQPVDPESRDALPHAILMDVLDIRCQYCPGQSFRRSRLRLQDLFLILVMRYSARCLRCGQRQTVNFMVAASGVPSSFKQARSLRNSESWSEYTSGSVPRIAGVKPVAPLPPVAGQLYTLKDIPVGYDAPLPVSPPEELVSKETRPAPTTPVKRRSGDQSIW